MSFNVAKVGQETLFSYEVSLSRVSSEYLGGAFGTLIKVFRDKVGPKYRLMAKNVKQSALFPAKYHSLNVVLSGSL